MLILSQYLIKTLKFFVFEVLVEAQTLTRKKEKKSLKDKYKLNPKFHQQHLVNYQREKLFPLFQYANT